MSTLSDGITTLELYAWTTYDSAREAGTIVHKLVSGRSAITLRVAAERNVGIAFAFDNEDDARVCERLLAGASVLTITNPGQLTSVGMQFVTTGSIEVTPDGESERWTVTSTAHEVGAP